MKKIITILMILTILLSFCGCGNNTAKNKIGDTVETDIAKFTLVNSQFAIKLNATYNTYSNSSATTLYENYFTAGTYDPEKDANLMYVAKKGHTYVVLEYKIENIDRGSMEFDNSMSSFVTVKYAGKKYTDADLYGCERKEGQNWVAKKEARISLNAGETKYYRSCVDIPVEAKNLDDEYVLEISVPTSEGKKETFSYTVKPEDRPWSKQNMNLDVAMEYLYTEEAKEYFRENMSEYTKLNNSELNELINSKESWRFLYADPGARTNMMMAKTIEPKTIIIDGDGVHYAGATCDVYKIAEGKYMLIQNDSIYSIIY